MGDTRGETADARELLRAHELALRVEQVVGHAIESLGERGEVASFGVGRAPGEVAVRHRIGGRNHALEGPQHQPVDQVAPKHDEHAHFQRYQEHHQGERSVRGEGAGHEDGRHAHEQGGGGEERQVEE